MGRYQLYVPISLFQLATQVLDLFSELVDETATGINIFRRFIGDEGCFGGIVESRYVFLEKVAVGTDAGNHETIGAATN